MLRQNDGALKARLDTLKQASLLPDLVSRIRVLDVVIWMRHHGEHRGTRCPGLAL